MACSRRIIVAYVAINTEAASSPADGLSARLSHLSDVVRDCGLTLEKRFVDDLAHIGGETGAMPPDLKRAVRYAMSRKCALAVHGELDMAALDEARALLREKHLPLYELGALRRARVALRAQSFAARDTGRKRDEAAQAGRARARANGKRFGSPDPLGAQNIARASQARLHEIRLREHSRWRAAARAQGVTAPKALAAWLNANGVLTPRGVAWSESNVRRVLLDLDRYELGQRETEDAMAASEVAPRAEAAKEDAQATPPLTAPPPLAAANSPATDKAADEDPDWEPDWAELERFAQERHEPLNESPWRDDLSIEEILAEMKEVPNDG